MRSRDPRKIFVNLVLVLMFMKQHAAEVTNYCSSPDKNMSCGTARNMTTSAGAPVPFENTQTIELVKTDSRLLLNEYFVESLTHFAAERIPGRVVHEKGTGAFGYFKVTRDLSDICKAQVFDTVGKETPVVARFSTTIQRPGAPDTVRDARGFAVKFYTEEGNYDFVGIHAEMFQIKDAVAFPAFSHTFHKHPKTMADDPNSMWDFLTQQPESLNMFMRIFGDRGIPDGYRHMPGYTIHTFELVNHQGKRTYARFRFSPDQGIKNLTTAQANQKRNPDFATRDIYDAIAKGNYPTWTLGVQTIPESEVNQTNAYLFDVTRLWPVELYPFRTIGKLTLNRNPDDQFSDIEQLAFNPGNLVPGIRGVDIFFEARVLSYRAANTHRLGVNFNRIEVNCPFRSGARTYNRDGAPPLGDNEGDMPHYYPNSLHGPYPYYVDNSPPRISVTINQTADNFDQANYLYEEMTEDEKYRLVDNIVYSLREAKEFLQEKAVKLYTKINKELGGKIEYKLKNIKKDSKYE